MWPSRSKTSLAKVAILDCPSFKDLIPVVLHQWYLSHLNRVVRIGLSEPYPWIITSISGQDDQVDSNDKLRKRSKKESILLTTTTSVQLTFGSYKIVICLDVSRSSFAISNCGMPFEILT